MDENNNCENNFSQRLLKNPSTLSLLPCKSDLALKIWRSPSKGFTRLEVGEIKPDLAIPVTRGMVIGNFFTPVAHIDLPDKLDTPLEEIAEREIANLGKYRPYIHFIIGAKVYSQAEYPSKLVRDESGTSYSLELMRH